jgi:hypothetical protein
LRTRTARTRRTYTPKKTQSFAVHQTPLPPSKLASCYTISGRSHRPHVSPRSAFAWNTLATSPLAARSSLSCHSPIIFPAAWHPFPPARHPSPTIPPPLPLSYAVSFLLLRVSVLGTFDMNPYKSPPCRPPRVAAVHSPHPGCRGKINGVETGRTSPATTPFADTREGRLADLTRQSAGGVGAR